ncbi:serine/threonine-protein kinase [Nonomuraea purpurea]|uniref:non-specific serine/threonine protein kinase n=1 Tax=Nonomuraea purpurea TaxID=1849276 RepID=A0ABV8G0N9_9ACTN
MSDSAGMVGGRYRLLRTIGRGGMGTVWQAHDEVLGRDVAIKEILPPPDLSEPEREVFAARTLREARAAGRVTHPGVAAVYDVLQERGHPWIVMQFVRSRTLGGFIREDGPMPPLEAARTGLQILEALRAAHAVGVLHRDVKPDNVLLAEDGRAVLTDFGIATTQDESSVTATGVLIGTPAFISPERAAGGRATPACDLWSLGVTLYMAVEGHSPFQRDNALTTLGAVLHAEPRPPARAGVLAPVLLGLLRKDPAERMSLEEAERRLAAIAAGGVPDQTDPFPSPRQPDQPGPLAGPQQPDQTNPFPVPRQAPVPRRRRRELLMAALAGGVLLVGIVAGGVVWWSQRPRELPRAPAPVPTSAVTTSAAPTSQAPRTSPHSPQSSYSPSAPPSLSYPPSRPAPSWTVSESPVPRDTQPKSKTPDGDRSPSGEPTPTTSEREEEEEQESPRESPGSQVEPSEEEQE